MCYIFTKYKILADLLYNYFNLKIIYYISEKSKIKFQSYIGLIYAKKDHFLLLCETLKKVDNHVF